MDVLILLIFTGFGMYPVFSTPGPIPAAVIWVLIIRATRWIWFWDPGSAIGEYTELKWGGIVTPMLGWKKINYLGMSV